MKGNFTMFKHTYIYLKIVTGIIFISATVFAQEFPIATDNDTTSAGRAVFDGTNYLIPIGGDALASNNLTAQLISSSGTLLGPRITVGKTGGGVLVAFDGSNYLMVWSDPYDVVYGQFINTSGGLVRTPFIIVSNATINGKGGCMAFGDSTYMVVWRRNDVHYGQRISKSGNLIGDSVQISFSPAKNNAICFDGTNYLVAWRSTGNSLLNIYGQLISKSGELVGSNFLIDANASDNPVSISYDGSRYLVAFHDHAINDSLCLSARFVTTAGSVLPDLIVIRDSPKFPAMPFTAFDGKNYLITWTDNFYTDSSVFMGRFFNTSGVSIGTAFTIFNSLNGKIAFYGMPTVGSNNILIVATRVDTPSFTNGDVYGKFIQSSTTGVNKNKINLRSKDISLSQNYPNPFNPSTTIRYAVPSALPCEGFEPSQGVHVTLKIYDLLGREIATLVDEEQSTGWKEVVWSGKEVSSGIYFYKLHAGNYTEVRKMIMVK